jgi:ATP-binding cassette, subfamily B, bacterial
VTVQSTSTRLYTDVVLYRRLLREARPYWPHIAGVFLIGLLATPVALLAPLPLKIAVDAITGKPAVPHFIDAVLPAAATRSTTGVLALAAVLVVGVALLTQLQQFGNSVLGTYTGEKLLLRFRARLFRHVQRLSLAFHDGRGTADSTYRIQYDAPSIQWIAIYGITPFVSAALTLAGMLYVTARIDLELAFIALGVAPVLFLLTSSYRRRLRSRWKTTKNLESQALAVVQEVLTGLRVVKAFGQEEREESRFLFRSGEGMRARIELAVIEGLFGLLTGMTLAAGSAAVLYLGGRHVQQGKLTAGELTLVFGYLLALYVPLQQISKSIVTLQSSLASAERAFSLLDELPDV